MRVLSICAAAVWLGVSAWGEAVAPTVVTVDAELRQMASQAGVIFAGQVLAVRPHTTNGMGSGWVEVEFRVDQAIRGCAGQPTYVLKEWSGLWAGGRQRYVVGQRALVMLHTPSAAGWSSPVGGQDGVIPLVGIGDAPGPDDRSTAATETAVDLRWIEARVERPAVQGTASNTAATMPRAVRRGLEAAQRLQRSGAGFVQGSADAQENAHPLRNLLREGLSLRSVLSLLNAWEAERSDGHP